MDDFNSPSSKHLHNDEQHQTPSPNEGMLNPLLSVWQNPKLTAQYVINHKSLGYCIMLMMIGYIGVILSNITNTDLYPTFPVWLIMVLVIVIGAIFGLISTAIYAGVILLVGKLFKGQASYKSLFKVLTLPAIPYLVLIPFFSIWIAVSPESMIASSYTRAAVSLSWLAGLLTLTTSIWSFVITIAVIAQAQKYSNWKAFFTILIPALVMFLALIVLAVIIFLVFMSIAIFDGPQ